MSVKMGPTSSSGEEGFGGLPPMMPMPGLSMPLDGGAPRMRMKPAVRRICCCSVTAASCFVAGYALVTYGIALVYELVWVIEAQSGLPAPAALLLLCYCTVIAATVVLLHGLMTENNKYLLAWLICIILVLIPECALVFYMSISYWGLQSMYGSAELICYVSRLPALVAGVVLVQSCYALREAAKDHLTGKAYNIQSALAGSEFDASHYVPSANDASLAFVNEAFMEDNNKLSHSMPDLRQHLQQKMKSNNQYPLPVVMPPPAYYQHYNMDNRHSLRNPRFYTRPAHPYHTETWIAPKTKANTSNNRRHSISGVFEKPGFENMDKNEQEIDDRHYQQDTKSEIGFPTGYPQYPSYYDYVDGFTNDPRIPSYPITYDGRFQGYPIQYHQNSLGDLQHIPDINDRNMYSSYGVNLLKRNTADPYNLAVSRERVFYGPMLNNSRNSMGNESDDLTKYKDVAL